MKRPLAPHPIFALLLAAALAGGPACAQTSLTPGMPLVAAPADPTPLEQVQQLVKQGQLDKALARADAAIAANPKNAQLRFVRAVVANDMGRTADAKAGFEQLIQDYPELPEPYNNLAAIIAAEGRLVRAEQLLKSALEASPNFATAHENLGDLYLRMAAEAYAQAVKFAPNNRQAAAKLAQVRELGKPTTKPR